MTFYESIYVALKFKAQRKKSIDEYERKINSIYFLVSIAKKYFVEASTVRYMNDKNN